MGISSLILFIPASVETPAASRYSPSQLFLGVSISAPTEPLSHHVVKHFPFFSQTWGWAGCLMWPVSVAVGCWWVCGHKGAASIRLRAVQDPGLCPVAGNVHMAAVPEL